MKKTLIATVLSFICLVLSAQDKSVIPPSPVSWEFAKYVTQKVSLYNGIPEISIPLYTIQLRGISIPISLSYHASGIKYHQDNGTAGLGWVINPGYRVSRIIYGYPDEEFPMLNGANDSLAFLLATDDLSTYNKHKRDRFLSKFDVWGQFYPPNGQRYDGEYDQFTFSTPTSVGEFIITDRDSKTVSTIEHSNNRINYSINGIEIDNIDISDEWGNRYFFGKYTGQTQGIKEYENGSGYPSAWGLVQITSIYGENVEFKYEYRSADGWNPYAKSFTLTENPTFCCVPTSYNESDVGSSNYNTFYQTEIITSKEQVIIKYNANGKVSDIQVLKKASQERVKNIKFYYSYDNEHVFLDSLAIYGEDSVYCEKYKFDYNWKGTNSTFSQDQWGFYKLSGDPINNIFHEEFKTDPINVGWTNDGFCGYNFQSVGYFVSSFFNRESDDNPSFFTLKRITYPTGGFTDYEFESGKYIDQGIIKKAGIRIKSITSYDSKSGLSLMKEFRYGIAGEEGYGYAEIKLDYSHFTDGNVIMDFASCSLDGVVNRKSNYYNYLPGDINVALNQSGLIKYPFITEYNYDLKNGKTEYQFSIGNTFDEGRLCGGDNTGYNSKGAPFTVLNYRLWDVPVLNKKSSYLWCGTHYKLLAEEILTYDKTIDIYGGIKVKQFAFTNPSSDGVLYPGYYDVPAQSYSLFSFFSFEKYSVQTGKNQLIRKQEFLYTDNDTLTIERNYEYNRLLLSKETVSKSTGEKIVKCNSYPFDYISTDDSFLDEMVFENAINYPIEEVSYLDNGVSQYILSGSIIKYKSDGKGLPESVWSLENTSPIALSSFKFSNSTTGTLPASGTLGSFSPDPRYVNSLMYDIYNTLGNLLQVHKLNDINVSYIWGYNNNYPVIKGDNIDNATLQLAVSNSLPSGFNSFEHLLTSDTGIGNLTTAVQKMLWKSFCQNLISQASLANSNITIYTYKPLVGMTSATNMNGITTYYDYDSFGRLENIRDNAGNVIKHFEYNYSNSSN